MAPATAPPCAQPSARARGRGRSHQAAPTSLGPEGRGPTCPAHCPRLGAHPPSHARGDRAAPPGTDSEGTLPSPPCAPRGPGRPRTAAGFTWKSRENFTPDSTASWKHCSALSGSSKNPIIQSSFQVWPIKTQKLFQKGSSTLLPPPLTQPHTSTKGQSGCGSLQGCAVYIWYLLYTTEI
ncbi:hypothetical protein MC885_007844 [Smutsia gigantea]|nr:hypothetical protein MC885_007844 [Smutsia gigantea]